MSGLNVRELKVNNVSDDFNELIKSSTVMIQECIDILNQQNKDSYRTIKVPNIESTTTFSNISSNLFDVQLMYFYKNFLPILQFIHNLKYSIRDMGYTNEDLSININRSPTFILELEHKFYNNKVAITSYYEKLEANNLNIIRSYGRHLHVQLMDYTIDLNTIKLLFKCMEYDFKFIPYGSIIFTQLFTDNLIPVEFRQNITSLSNMLKIKYLSVINPSNNNQLNVAQSKLLQTYNLIPTTVNLSLSQIFSQTFGIANTNVNIDNLESVLKSTSKTLSKSVSFIVVSKWNNDFYYNIDNLFDIKKLSTITNSIGVSTNYIDIFNILESNLIVAKIVNDIRSYNYSNTSETYILWTNDNTNFKLRGAPVPANITNKIVNNRSSEVIDLYNSSFENKLLTIIKNDSLVSYKQIKYLSFNIDDEENAFIENLCQSISKYIKSITKIANELNMVDKMVKIIQLEFTNFKPFHISKSVSMQPVLIYNNMAIQIANRVKKDITQWYHNNGPVSQIDIIVKAIIASNDNIYTKFIASYYLDMSGI